MIIINKLFVHLSTAFKLKVSGPIGDLHVKHASMMAGFTPWAVKLDNGRWPFTMV